MVTSLPASILFLTTLKSHLVSEILGSQTLNSLSGKLPLSLSITQVAIKELF